MNNPNAIGLDIAKNVFQICAVTPAGKVQFNRQIRRNAVLATFQDLDPTVVAIEGCGSSHYWAEQIEALGHSVRLIPPQHVKPFIRGHKHDANDAAALAVAATRDDIPLSVRRTPWQRHIQFLVRRRERRVTSRVRLINQCRGFLGENGIVIPRTVSGFKRHIPQTLEPLADSQSPLYALVVDLLEELDELQQRINADDRELKHIAQSTPACQRLMQIPGIGYLNATSLVAAVGPDSGLRNGRHMAAWLGLTPRMHGTGGKIRHGSITHRGNPQLRRLLVHGARAAMNAKYDDPVVNWAKALAKRQGHNKAVVALANKLARIAWVVIHREQAYCPINHRPKTSA